MALRTHYQSIRVPVAPFRDYALKRIREGQTWSSLAQDAGYTKSAGRHRSGDTTALKRRLGLSPEGDTKLKKKHDLINYDTAVRLCVAWQLDPTEYGV